MTALIHRYVICCGDRNWNDTNQITKAMSGLRDVWPELHPSCIHIVHGAARGADELCGEIAQIFGYTVHEFPAQWRIGKGAGPIRNQAMLTFVIDHDPSPQFIMAFHDNIGESKGTRDMIRRARKAGLDVALITSSMERMELFL